MLNAASSGTFVVGRRAVNRLGYGAMQLAGPGVFGPPRNNAAAVAILREAVQRGINHIDTSDFYGPHVANQLIREAPHPYPDRLAQPAALRTRGAIPPCSGCLMKFSGANCETMGSHEVFDFLEHDTDGVGAAAAFRHAAE